MPTLWSSHSLQPHALKWRRIGKPNGTNGKAAKALPSAQEIRPLSAKWLVGAIVSMVLILCGAIVLAEFNTSWLQSRIFSRAAEGAAYEVQQGRSASIYFPSEGPYNDRLGYMGMGSFVERLLEATFGVDSQAVISQGHQDLLELGLFPIYREKNQAGLSIADRNGVSVFEARYPANIYPSFEAVPQVIWKTLLYIENRELLDERHPNQNPAVEWDRFARALFLQALEGIGLTDAGPGASTLATQLEKFRYSPDGLTGSAREKLRQMVAASVRAYLDGPETLNARRRIVRDYLNSLPLGGRSGYGEVTGLAEGLAVWYGADFEEVNGILSSVGEDSTISPEAARYYRHVLSLILATRRPSYLLPTEAGRAALASTTDRYLAVLARDGVIPNNLARRSKEITTGIVETMNATPPLSFVGRKAATAVRIELMDLLDVGTAYELDHYDLSVQTTFERGVQTAITNVLDDLSNPETVRSRGMQGAWLLGAQDPSNVYFAITLFEAAPDGNHLIVQTDNFEGPFNINAGSKLELGSTAKLRTLVNYLQIVARLYVEHNSGVALDEQEVYRSDRITRWAADYLRNRPEASLPEILDAALNRTYSASPYEQFFTGGGAHVFHNFSASDSTSVYSVRTGFRHSVNLVFIRLMRDIVSFYTARLPGNPVTMLDDVNDPRRIEYLRRFADRDGRTFLWRFYERYQSQSDDTIWQTFLAEHRSSVQRFAWAIRSVIDEISEEEFADLLDRHGFARPSDRAAALYEKVDPASFGWHDRGYLAGVHPLELWYLQFRYRHPDATWADVVGASTVERQDAYAWLFKSTAKRGQDSRIRTLIEEDAFVEIHTAWADVGYPFGRLVPSLATAIGSSADRPTALADLVGIIMRGGLKYPTMHIQRLHFADATPYETVMSPRPQKPVRVLPADVAVALRGMLVDVVEHGTAIRIKGALRDSEGAQVTVGGKTGTGDNRMKLYGPTGGLIGSEVRSRTSTFVFFIDDRLFGTVTAYVTGPEASRHRFTSSLPVQLLKALGPELAPIL